MGTRADFYVGEGKDAEWLGSIAWDGYPSNDVLHNIFRSQSEEQYRSEVSKMLSGRKDDATLPEMGWPWPWEDSRTTDYSYSFQNNRVMASGFGYAWFDPFDGGAEDKENYKEGDKLIFPNMKDRMNATLGPRSGLIILTSPKH